MSPEVESYAGATYPERPKAFHWDGQRYHVQEIIQRRREPEGTGFLVRCDLDEKYFDLFYNSIENRWRITPK